MSHGVSPQLPLGNPESDGAYGLNKTIPEAVKQNIKHLLLTNPGEKMMDPTFGVGLRRLLFEQDIRYVQSEIEARIQNQVRMYIPHIILLDVELLNRYEESALSPNAISIKIKYRIIPLNEQDLLDITIE